MAYPEIFLGQARPDNKQRLVNITYSDICKSELRQSDRRAAMCIENIFYKTKKLQMKILLGKSHIALRKCKGNNKNITAGQIKQQGTLDRLIRHDDGYKFLNALFLYTFQCHLSLQNQSISWSNKTSADVFENSTGDFC